MKKKGQQSRVDCFSYELAPVKSDKRGAEREAEYVTGKVECLSIGAATRAAIEKAAALSAERGREYGVVRVY